MEITSLNLGIKFIMKNEVWDLYQNGISDDRWVLRKT